MSMNWRGTRRSTKSIMWNSCESHAKHRIGYENDCKSGSFQNLFHSTESLVPKIAKMSFLIELYKPCIEDSSWNFFNAATVLLVTRTICTYSVKGDNGYCVISGKIFVRGSICNIRYIYDTGMVVRSREEFYETGEEMVNVSREMGLNTNRAKSYALRVHRDCKMWSFRPCMSLKIEKALQISGVE